MTPKSENMVQLSLGTCFCWGKCIAKVLTWWHGNTWAVKRPLDSSLLGWQCGSVWAKWLKPPAPGQSHPQPASSRSEEASSSTPYWSLTRGISHQIWAGSPAWRTSKKKFTHIAAAPEHSIGPEPPFLWCPNSTGRWPLTQSLSASHAECFME